MAKFELISDFKPQGDQPRAIAELTAGLAAGKRHQVLLGVTGSGKTFTLANVIANFGKSALVISPNKTLAAQLYSEFKAFFPHNAVEYFVSYYDYYQPEAYIPQTDTYIEKDASINDELDRLRLKATSSLLSRDDVVVVASVSSIYGLGSPEEHRELFLFLEAGATIERQVILRRLVTLQYERNDVDLQRGKFRVRGEIVEIFPAYEEKVVRIELSDDRIGRIAEIDPLTTAISRERDKVAIYPAKHFVSSPSRVEQAICSITQELAERLAVLRKENKLLEVQRLETRTRYDIEMMQEIGYCQGIENYSRHLSGRLAGEPPYTLIDYFPRDYLLIIDESHVAIPQIRGMYYGDRSRKETLTKHGFRLPSALDNRPLNFAEFEKRAKNTIYVSATPGPYELKKVDTVIEQIIRPTGIVDPRVSVRPTAGQVDDLASEIKKRVGKKQRVLVTTLTKRTSEDLAGYLYDMGLKVRYLHSEIGTLERAEILRDLRVGKFDCLVGINLLREGLDLPEVTLVAILDADKEGFLRSQTSLIQVAGRAARNIDSEVLMYADTITGSMKRAIKEMERRSRRQKKFNEENDITPRTIKRSVRELIALNSRAADYAGNILKEPRAGYIAKSSLRTSDLKEMMLEAASRLDFEKAALLRDQIAHLSGQKKKQSRREAVRGKIV
ncbi:excinuclease ABC subunit UvrB [candidate division NPL-UPA2 bacterium Unc8]|uniref:UvrABC system protein B n=1 Tax=candidate division NPL-UPA2 bacterium Unc8 TaxID=1980939 RepID=A0A399FXZ4_UNCN2|nr:UvrABC system protein B [Bacillota bacterium]MBT9146791.1 UvrABC system protein B [Bacillota bacterium]RII00987.1 MAG: excinuclease ABC subunit UvrB [candidate division NPL-UPA2 bacterium Unc8]